MQYQYIPYIWPLMISGAMTISLGCYLLIRHRNTKGAFSFAVSMFVVTFWSIPNAFEMAAINLPTKLFWANVQYFAYCYCPVTLLILVMQLTGYDKLVKSRNIFLLLVIPTITIFLVWTNDYHSLIRYNVKLNATGSFPVISKEYGIAFYIHAFYSHLLNISAMLTLLRALFYQKYIYRKSMVILFIGVCFIEVPSVLYILGLSPIKHIDITPVFFGPSGFFILWSMFRYHMYDLVPLARASVIETMNAGIIVLDLQERILDTNPAFNKMIGYSTSQMISKNIKEISKKLPEFYKICLNEHLTHTEFTVIGGTEPKEYEIYVSPLYDNNAKALGKMFLIYEITEKKKVREELLKQQWMMAAMEERERIARDMHDNLGQILGFVNLQAQGIRQELINLGINDVTDKLDRLVNVTQQAHTEIREYIQDIRNTALIEKDFVKNLNYNIQNFRIQTGIKVLLEIPEDFNTDILEPNTWIHILNIIKEALNNIRKHAGATLVQILLILSPGQLGIIIEDNGKGFTNQQNNDTFKTKFGLDIMRERTFEIGGEFTIETAPGKGCIIRLDIPW